MTDHELIKFMSADSNPDRVSFFRAYAHVKWGWYGALHRDFVLFRNAMPENPTDPQSLSWGEYKRRANRTVLKPKPSGVCWSCSKPLAQGIHCDECCRKELTDNIFA